MSGFLTIMLQAVLLTGTAIGSSPSVDYSTGRASTTVNTPVSVFDGDMNTYYASYDRNNTWVGLDLGSQHIITRAGWAARNDGVGPSRMILGLIEGANSPDFGDAVPLYLIDAAGKIGEMTYADINCSKGFRYVRYCGPNNSRCNIAELQFYGYPGAGDNTHFYRPTNLPCVVIHTESGQDPQDKVNDLTCIVSIIDAKGKLLTDSATTRLRGNASATFEKKPYRIKFNSKHTVLDSKAKAKKWTLINNYGDKTLMRNLLAFRISEIMGMPYTPWARPVDVFMNGEYKGCYQLCDQVEVGKGRVDIEEMKTTDIAGEALTGGYFWEIDAYADQEISWFKSNKGNPVTIKSPKEEDITTEQYNFLKAYFNSMEADVYGNQFANPTTGWRRLLDANTFLKHFLIGEMSGNTDTYWSVYQYKRRSEDKIYTGPVWDFDLAFNNDQRTYPVTNKSDYVYRSGGSCAGNMATFVNRIIISDPATKDELKTLWSIARNHGLTAEKMTALADSFATEIDASQRLNFTRWPMLNQRVHQNPQVAGSYKGEVNVVKAYLTNRIQWMDNKVGYDPNITDVKTEEKTIRANKYINNGQLHIERNGQTYDIFGRKIR